MLELVGSLVGPDASQQLRDHVAVLLAHGDRRVVVVDLKEVCDVDSDGLGELVRAFMSLSRGGRSFRMMNPPRRVQDLLVVSPTLLKLLSWFRGGKKE